MHLITLGRQSSRGAVAAAQGSDLSGQVRFGRDRNLLHKNRDHSDARGESLPDVPGDSSRIQTS
jgi:hypothetical protein